MEKNRLWAEKIKAQDPAFFEELSKQQTPQYLWVGCSDSRVPANQIIGVSPGELFVHRNVANVVVHTDLNCLSVIQFAVDVLSVKHLIVCGHYGCGGVQAALDNSRLGLIDNWLRHVQDVRQKHEALLTEGDETQRLNKLCELNVIEQVSNVCQTTIVQGAWERGQELAVHGWIYALSDGLIRDLKISTSNQDELAEIYNNAIAVCGRSDILSLASSALIDLTSAIPTERSATNEHNNASLAQAGPGNRRRRLLSQPQWMRGRL